MKTDLEVGKGEKNRQLILNFISLSCYFFCRRGCFQYVIETEILNFVSTHVCDSPVLEPEAFNFFSLQIILLLFSASAIPSKDIIIARPSTLPFLSVLLFQGLIMTSNVLGEVSLPL